MLNVADEDVRAGAEIFCSLMATACSCAAPVAVESTA
jgi:hypothetical protein